MELCFIGSIMEMRKLRWLHIWKIGQLESHGSWKIHASSQRGKRSKGRRRSCLIILWTVKNSISSWLIWTFKQSSLYHSLCFLNNMKTGKFSMFLQTKTQHKNNKWLEPSPGSCAGGEQPTYRRNQNLKGRKPKKEKKNKARKERNKQGGQRGLPPPFAVDKTCYNK